MFSLISGLFKYFFSKPEYHALILGLDNAGKTTLLEGMKPVYAKQPGLPADRIVPTVGQNLGRFIIGRIRLVCWDLGGQLSLRAIWEKYYREAQALIFVIDSAAPDRFSEARQTLELVMQQAALMSVPVLVFCNKQDLETALPVSEIESRLDIHPAQPIKIVGLSALHGDGISTGIEWLVDQLQKLQPKREE
nr:Arfrp1 [Gefionella okellyi]